MSKKIAKGLFFFVLGAGLFWYVYRDLDLHLIGETMKELKYGWIFLSFFFGLTSHFIRAVRWRMLIKPIGYSPRTLNLFLSVLVLYLINLIVPRGGEIGRCGAVTRFEKVPFVKLLGTVFIERITDLLMFLLILIAIVVWKWELINQLFLELPMDFTGYQANMLTIASVGIFVVLLYLGSQRLGLLERFQIKIKSLKNDIKQGVKAILLVQNRWMYSFYTGLIFLLWLLMLYVIFFAYAPTSNLSFAAAVFAFTMGTFAYLLPIQAGIGVWHFLIIQSLLLFGLEKDMGMIYALIAHTFTNLIYLVLGSVGFVMLPLVNQGKS